MPVTHPRHCPSVAPALFVLLLMASAVATLAAAPAEEPPSPAARIASMRRLDDTIIRRQDFTGDNWHTTWAADGHQYVLQCDGRGYNTRLWRLRGAPPDFTFEPVPSHPGPAESD